MPKKEKEKVENVNIYRNESDRGDPDSFDKNFVNASNSSSQENGEIKKVVTSRKEADPIEDLVTLEDSGHVENAFSDTVSRPNKPATPSHESENIENLIL